MRPIDFKTSNYVQGMPYYAGFVVIIIGLLLLTAMKFVTGFAVLLAGVLIITTHYRMSIDLINKTYSEYISVLGLKTGKEQTSFPAVDYIFIKRKKVSQTLNSRIQSATIQKEQYDGYIRFGENHKVHLITCETKTALAKKLQPLAQILKVDLIDYSDGNPVAVNSK